MWKLQANFKAGLLMWGTEKLTVKTQCKKLINVKKCDRMKIFVNHQWVLWGLNDRNGIDFEGLTKQNSFKNTDIQDNLRKTSQKSRNVFVKIHNIISLSSSFRFLKVTTKPGDKQTTLQILTTNGGRKWSDNSELEKFSYNKILRKKRIWVSQ